MHTHIYIHMCHTAYTRGVLRDVQLWLLLLCARPQRTEQYGRADNGETFPLALAHAASALLSRRADADIPGTFFGGLTQRWIEIARIR